jgi:photosystem II stability/assembly factor-like uncharacterized protein
MRMKLDQIFIMVLLSAAIVVPGFAGGGVFAGEALDPLDPLMHPAIQWSMPNKTVLQAVTTAGKRLVAVGECGMIILSDDEGVTWRQGKVPVSVTLTGVYFVTPEKGWAVGHSGIVLHSDDGGETWVKQLDGIKAAQLALDAANARLQRENIESEALKRQVTDAQLLVDDGSDKPFLDVYFKDKNTGFIVGAYNLIFRTEDGGKTWQPWMDHVVNPESFHLYSIRPSGGNIYIAGERGLFMRSTDGGNTFCTLPTPYVGSFFGLMVFGEKVMVYGLRGNAFCSSDRGNSWQKVETGVHNSITCGVQFKEGAVFLATQTGDILVGSDQHREEPSIKLRPVSLCETPSIVGLTESSEGNLILVGLQGAARVVEPVKLMKGYGGGKNEN